MSDIAALFTWVNMRFLLQGLGMTLLISALAILCSVVLGTVISVMRTSNARVLRGIATVYIEIFKNTPLLLWIMFTFFVAQLPPIGAAVLAFTLFTSASVAEIVRGGLASVPHGQYEAARSQGFSTVQTYVLIILPQALRNMVPALLSQFVTTIKDTSYLWGAMALQELMGRGMILMNSYNSTVQIFAIFGIISCAIDIITFPFPIPELPPGSPLSASTMIPLPPEVPFEVCISSRVTTRFSGECDFDATVRKKGGGKHVFPAILINPGGRSAVTIYRLWPEDKHHQGSLVFTNGIQSCLLNMDTMQMKSLNGPASNYPPPSSEDLSGEDMNLRLETVGLYRGLSFVRGAEHSATTRSYILKILENMQARAERLKEATDRNSSESLTK